MALVALSRHRLCCLVAPPHCVGLATKASQQHGRFNLLGKLPNVIHRIPRFRESQRIKSSNGGWSGFGRLHCWCCPKRGRRGIQRQAQTRERWERLNPNSLHNLPLRRQKIEVASLVENRNPHGEELFKAEGRSEGFEIGHCL